MLILALKLIYTMKPILFILSLLILITSCSEPNNAPNFITDNKFIAISGSEFNGEITSMKFHNSQEALLTTSNGYLWKTFDGGETWVDSNIFDQSWLGNLHFFNSNYGFCSGNDSNTFVYNSASWNYFNFPVKKCAVSSFFMPSENEIYATSNRGENNQSYLVYSNNRGNTWDTLYSALNDFKQVLFLDNETGFIITHTENKLGLMKTNNGGASWYARVPSAYGSFFNNTAQLVKLVAIDKNNLILIGRGSKKTEGLLLTSSDAGENWNVEILPYAINDIAITNNFVYLVGDELFAIQWPINLSMLNTPSGIINSWNKYKQDSSFYKNKGGLPIYQYYDIKNIQFIDDQTGFIATNNQSMVFKINITE